jgi:hypothetical protein
MHGRGKKLFTVKKKLIELFIDFYIGSALKYLSSRQLISFRRILNQWTSKFGSIKRSSLASKDKKGDFGGTLQGSLHHFGIVPSFKVPSSINKLSSRKVYKTFGVSIPATHHRKCGLIGASADESKKCFQERIVLMV